MDLQFFGGRGAKSNKNNATLQPSTESSLEPSPELDKVKPRSKYEQNVTNEFNDMLRSYQASEGVTISENDLKLMEDKIREMTSSDEVYIGIRFRPDILDDILNSGRFKSQFETKSSGGFLDTTYRAKVESSEMGYSPSKTSPEDRPVYGMLFEGKTSAEIRPSLVEGDWYGGAVAIFKPSVKAHTTVTFDDSLDNFKNITPSPLLKPSRYSIPVTNQSDFKRFYKTAQSGSKMTLSSVISKYNYAEVQIHNRQASISNIERIIFPKGTSQSSIPVDLLKKHNIKYSIEK